MKNIKSKQVFIAVALVGLVSVLLIYVLVYMDYTEKATAIENSNRTLRQEVADLKVYYDNRGIYQTQMDEMKLAIANVLDEYPVDAREEDALMMAAQLQNNVEVQFANINMTDDVQLHSIPTDVISAAGMSEQYPVGINFFDMQATYVNVTSYENLKNMIAQIYANPNRIAINNVSYSRNDTDGTLEGSVSVSFYTATGTGKEYQAPDITPYLSGVTNIFGNVPAPVEETTAEGGE